MSVRSNDLSRFSELPKKRCGPQFKSYYNTSQYMPTFHHAFLL